MTNQSQKGNNDYTTGIKEIDDTIGGIKNGSNILLIGPAMSGKETISNHIIHDNESKNENAVLVVTTCEPGIKILERIKKREPNLSLSRMGLVDCVSIKYGSRAVENENIKFVNGPEDLTAIGVKISQFLEDFFMKKKIQKIQLHINSLSTLLMYSNIQRVFRFLHVLTGRIKMMNGLGIYVMESEMHEKQIIMAIKQLCDGMIEIKSDNGRNFLRTVGLEHTSWLEYQIEKENVIIVKDNMTYARNVTKSVGACA
jgi:KaiC/GvpD/RAD55 family RecA-like ATPase